jgi:hypothetical protein
MPGHANHLTHGLDATPAVSVPRNGRVSMVVTSLAYVLSFRRARQCAAVQAVAVGRRCAR